MKRRFYILSHDPNPRLVFVERYELGDFDESSLLLADKLEHAPPDSVRLLVNGSKIWHDYINNPLSWDLLSTPFKKGISDLVGGDDQFFEIALHDTNSDARYTGFWLANFTNKIDCLDTGRSVIRRRETGVIEAIPKVIVRRDSVPESLHFFRVSAFPFHLIIDGEVFSRIYELGVKGMGMIECETV